MDLFHANGLKAHRNSFETTIENVTNEITTLNRKYLETWEQLNFYRKKWAAIQEDMIVIARNSNHRFHKSLDLCNNDEIIEEIKSLMKFCSRENKYKLLGYLEKISIYYSNMQVYSKKLEEYSNILGLIHFKEEDKDDELIIDLDEYRKQYESFKEESIQEQISELNTGNSLEFDEVSQVPLIKIAN